MLSYRLSDSAGNLITSGEDETPTDRKHMNEQKYRNELIRYEKSMVESWFAGTLKPSAVA